MKLNAKYIGNDVIINGLNLCNRSSIHDSILTYVTNENYVNYIGDNRAVVCIVLSNKDLEEYQKIKNRDISFIVSEEPETLFYDIHEYLFFHTDFYEKYDFKPQIGEKCNIHPNAVIEKGVMIGNNVSIGANTIVRKGTVIQDNCRIGNNTIIGSEGFQVIKENGRNRKIVHSGGVLICRDTSIGDNVTICNSLFENTARIGKNVMIDNHAYIAHNVIIEDNVVITAATVLCGSSTVGREAWIGVNSSVLNRVAIGDKSKIGIGSVVTRDIPQESLAYGIPAKVKKDYKG